MRTLKSLPFQLFLSSMLFLLASGQSRSVASSRSSEPEPVVTMIFAGPSVPSAAVPHSLAAATSTRDADLPKTLANDYLNPPSYYGFRQDSGPCRPGHIYTVYATWVNRLTSPILLDAEAVKVKLVHRDGTESDLITNDVHPAVVAPGRELYGVFDIALAKCTSFSFYVNIISRSTPLNMKLNNLTMSIDPANKYSEDTWVDVQAVRADTGAKVDFSGEIQIAENGTNAYGVNGGALPVKTTVTSGSGLFWARSLVGPKAGLEGTAAAKPDSAHIVTAPYPIYAAPFHEIPQWFEVTATDAKAVAGKIIAWAEARTRDIFQKADSDNRDLKPVMASVSTYAVKALGAGVLGQTLPTMHAASQPIEINPFFPHMRLDTSAGTFCGQPRTKGYTNTTIHEGRHAYITHLSSANYGARNDIPGSPFNTWNDEDADYLVDVVPVNPFWHVIDDPAQRVVCTEATATRSRQGYKGDAVADALDGADNARRGLEMDAYRYAGCREAFSYANCTDETAIAGRRPAPLPRDAVFVSAAPYPAEKTFLDQLARLAREGQSEPALLALHAIAESSALSALPGSENWPALGVDSASFSLPGLSHDSVRYAALLNLGSLQREDQEQYLLDHWVNSPDTPFEFRMVASLAVWQSRVARAPDPEAQARLLEQALSQKVGQFYADSVQTWAADELCNRGVSRSVDAITKAILARNALADGQKRARLCELKVAALNAHPDRREALATVLSGPDPSDDLALSSWAVDELIRLEDPTADNTLINFVTRTPGPQLLGLRLKVVEDLQTQRGWTRQRLNERGIVAPVVVLH